MVISLTWCNNFYVKRTLECVQLFGCLIVTVVIGKIMVEYWIGSAFFSEKTGCILYCWFVRGRIKEKIDTIYAIKHQVYCIANIAQWSANTVLLFYL